MRKREFRNKGLFITAGVLECLIGGVPIIVGISIVLSNILSYMRHFLQIFPMALFCASLLTLGIVTIIKKNNLAVAILHGIVAEISLFVFSAINFIFKFGYGGYIEFIIIFMCSIILPMGYITALSAVSCKNPKHTFIKSWFVPSLFVMFEWGMISVGEVIRSGYISLGVVMFLWGIFFTLPIFFFCLGLRMQMKDLPYTQTYGNGNSYYSQIKNSGIQDVNMGNLKMTMNNSGDYNE